MKTVHPYPHWRRGSLSICFLGIVLGSFAPAHSLHAQYMYFTVESLADDEFAHPWDDPDTPEDESIDGILEDQAHRKTLRAGLEEAAFRNEAAYATFASNLVGNLMVNDGQGTLGPPDNSVIQGVAQKVIITGSSNSILLGLSNNTLVAGLGFSNALIGILVGGDDNQIGGSFDSVNSNFIHNCSQNGILIAGNNNHVTGNRIGIAYDNSPAGNQFGIFITGKNNTIGGLNPADQNIISGNDIGIGVYTIEGKNFIQGNKIGTSLSGTHAVPNRVGIDNIGPNLEIGKEQFIGGNVISGNTESGILNGLDGDTCFIIGNYIGTDPSGTIAVPNRDGITLGPGSFLNTVSFNKIAHNTQNGVLINGFPDPEGETVYNFLEGNEIYLNGNAGVALVGSANRNIIGSFTNDFAEPNDIRFNGTAGVQMVPQFSAPFGNTVRRNIMQDNSLLGIYILDGQAGIQPPELTTYVDPGQGSVTVTGHHALAGAIIDFYDGDANQSGNYEGITWIGETLTDPAGNFSTSFPSCSCDTIVATATDAAGNTSEFSNGFGLMTSLREFTSIQNNMTFPNPFQQNVVIRFTLEEREEVKLEIFDATGKAVTTLLHATLSSGEHEVKWSPENQTTGVFYYRISSGSNGSVTGKMILVK